MLRFRNLNVSPSDPVDRWGVEGLLAAIERGTAPDWVRVLSAIRAAPVGDLREELDEALSLADGGGVHVFQLALQRMDESSEGRALRRMQRSLRMAEMSITEFAQRVGTSRSRMSTYLAGKVMPAADLVERMIVVGESRRREIMAR